MSVSENCIYGSEAILLLTSLVAGSIGLGSRIDVKLLAKIALATNAPLFALTCYEIKELLFFSSYTIYDERAVDARLAKIKAQTFPSLFLSVVAIVILCGGLTEITSVRLGISMVGSSLICGIGAIVSCMAK